MEKKEKARQQQPDYRKTRMGNDRCPMCGSTTTIFYDKGDPPVEEWEQCDNQACHWRSFYNK